MTGLLSEFNRAIEKSPEAQREMSRLKEEGIKLGLTGAGALASEAMGYSPERMEEVVEDLQEEVEGLKEKYRRVIDLNGELMHQLEQQVEISRGLYQKLKDKSGEKPERNLKTRHPKKGYA